MGGLRTALFNYLFAKSQKGSFIIRIEDTDQTRLVEGAAEKLIADLEWIGLKADESPLTGEAKYGPYIQSQRLGVYQEEVKPLLESGAAYHCFCTERRLDLLRRDALRARQVPKYDNRCRHLTPGQVAEKMAANDRYCIRFRLEDYEESFADLIYGDVAYNVATNEGDPVILKSDGYPTYHFANVVDDHLMRITHVLRGVEWQVSTTKHLLLYKALGWTPPQFGHLPLILNPDGSKLSKRQGDIQLEHYKTMGVYPLPLLNYIIQSGGGFDIDPSQKSTLYSLSELIEKFDVSRINVHSSRLNPVLLNDLNQSEIQRRLTDPQETEQLIEEVRLLVTNAYPEYIKSLDLEAGHIGNILKWSSTRINSLHDLVDARFAFLWVLPQIAKSETITLEVVESLAKELEAENFTKDSLHAFLKSFSKTNKLSFGELMKNLRGVLSGLKEGPGVAEMMEILGKRNTIQRIVGSKQKKTKE